MTLQDMARLAVVALLLGACSVAGPPLPGAYAVHYGDRGKAWLANPDGMIAHGALIKQLFSDGRHILLISFATTYGGQIKGPRPLDGNCYIALLIDSRTRDVRQVRLSEANHIAGTMSIVETYERGCLQGMPTA